MKLQKVRGVEVLDSRGNPTLAVIAETKKCSAEARVPSGASTGIHEAHELRDGGKRYDGKGVRNCVKNVSKISRKLKGMSVADQEGIDQAMLDMDGSFNKENLGANTILGVSMAVSRLGAKERGAPLYRHLQKESKQRGIRLPMPFANILNGGKHAGNRLAIQEFMIAPRKAASFSEATRMVAETYHELKGIIARKHGKNATNVGDEGGFAPPLTKAEEALDLIMKAKEKAGHANQLGIAIDAAASEFYKKGKYHLHKQMTAPQLQTYYGKLISDYPIISLEDPFDEDDFDAWHGFDAGRKTQVVGDDLTVTNVERIKLAQERDLCDALLLKINQIGSITESIRAARLAYKDGWNVMVSHRSGETSDTFISDLAVGLGCGQIKLGAPCRGERTAKYNRLLMIEDELGKRAKMARWNRGR